MTFLKTPCWRALLLSSAMIGGGCERTAAPPGASAGGAAAGTTLPAELFVSQAPAGARSVAEVRADPSLTGEVVVQGRVGGRQEPFVDGAAVFLLADAGMKSCRELHGDSCKTPWDYCCEPPEALAARIATIQVVGSDGKPLRADLKGKIQPLALLTLSGTVARRDAGTLVINATRIHVAGGNG